MKNTGINIYNPELQNILTQQSLKYPELNKLNILDRNGILVLPRDELKRKYFSNIDNVSIANLKFECDRLFNKAGGVEDLLGLLSINLDRAGIPRVNMDNYMLVTPSEAFREFEIPEELEKKYYIAYLLTLMYAFPEPGQGLGHKKKRRSKQKRHKKKKSIKRKKV
jgi:hypothetical protein